MSTLGRPPIPDAPPAPGPEPAAPAPDRSLEDVGATEPSSAIGSAIPPPDDELPIGRHTFEDLSGTAGTGKTWMARDLVGRQPGVALAATTGIAAINLGAGTTINSLLHYFDTKSLEKMYTNEMLRMQLNVLRRAGILRIVLDEKSMLDGLQLTYLARAIEEVNDPAGGLDTIGESVEEAHAREELTEQVASLPPIGLTLIGDFGQLAPVKAPFAFESPMWDRFAAHRTILTEVKRQDEQDFIQGLHAVRYGDAAAALRLFTSAIFCNTLDDSYAGSTVFAKNMAVARYNQLRLDQLMTPVVTCAAARWGKRRGEWKQIPETLRLKDGALVMLLANNYTERGVLNYVNGDLGRFVGFDADGYPVVDLVRGHAVRVEPITRECLEPLTPERRKILEDTGFSKDRIKGKEEIVGEVTYTPMRLAWATTVHKSQGLTLDRCQINLSDGFFKSPGMLFVALSRARTMAGLRLVGSPQQFATRCTTNPVVRPWL